MEGAAVRDAVVEDVPAIRRIAERGWDAAYADVCRPETIERAIETWYDPDAIARRIDDEGGMYLVAERNGAIVGYVSGGPADEPDVATLGAIYVDPDHWGGGIGSALLDAFEARSLDRGCTCVELEVLAENDVGVSFYDGHGFEVVEDRGVELFGEAVDELLLRRRLS